MKYMLMMNTMKAAVNPFPGWTEKDFQTMISFMIKVDEDLKKSGELVFAEGLSFPDQAKLVHAGKDGMPVTDGIFPESKEFLAGFWIIDVATPGRAYEIAALVSACPGKGGQPLNMSIEVRPVAGPPPKKPSL